MSDKKFNNIKNYLDHWNKFFVEWNNDKEGTFKKNIWSSHRGKGNDKLEFDVFPQPYLGDVKNHSVISLNLNPSRSKKNKENIKFEEKHLPKFDDAKNYYEYAKYFPTYNIEFWKKQADWIDRIFENLEKEKPSEKQIKPFAIEICPWGSKSFQALKIDDHLIGYMDKHVFDIIGKANENSKLQIVFSVGKAYYDIFKDHKFEKIEEFTKYQNSEPYVLFIESNNNDFEENIKEMWPKTKDKNGNHRYVNRSFSFWRKNNVIYYNSWGPGSNNPPGKNFHIIEKKLFQNYD
tara:strand:- start:488 stop:1360 length:873 start_codon:yes stop_codon:yes gene_type:complete